MTRDRRDAARELRQLSRIAHQAALRHQRMARTARAIALAVESGRVDPDAARRRARELLEEAMAEAGESISDALVPDPGVRRN